MFTLIECYAVVLIIFAVIGAEGHHFLYVTTVGYPSCRLFILVTLRDQPTAHTLDRLAVGTEERYLSD